MNSMLRVTAWLVGLAAAALPAIAQAQTAAADLAALKADYKRPAPRPAENQNLVELGRLLFWDPRSSASGATACASCHFPYLGWSVADQRSRNDSGKLTSRRSQTLLGVAYIDEGPFGRQHRQGDRRLRTHIRAGHRPVRPLGGRRRGRDF